MSRGLIPTLLIAFSAIIFFSLGNLFAARQAAATDNEQIAELRAEVGALRRQRGGVLGTTGHTPALPAVAMDDHSRAALVADIKQQLTTEMGLMPVSMLRERRQSFVEMYSYDGTGASNYGTAGYLGHGYFITVKHGVIALGEATESREDHLGEDHGQRPRAGGAHRRRRRRPGRGRSRRLGHPEGEGDGRPAAAQDEPGLRRSSSPTRSSASGNDYSKGIILSTGNVGQRTANNLVTCLTDGHPGVSGGGVLNGDGQLVGIPIGRMQGDYRFSFILPLRGEMFRKVSFLN